MEESSKMYISKITTGKYKKKTISCRYEKGKNMTSKTTKHRI